MIILNRLQVIETATTKLKQQQQSYLLIFIKFYKTVFQFPGGH